MNFLGHRLSGDGIKPDPKKIEAILDMPLPSNKIELQRFLGMVNYLGKFLPNVLVITAPLRQLLQKETIFNIGTPQVDVINQLKQKITATPVLQIYNPSSEIRLRTDASIDGLGAMLEQNNNGEWHPIAYASRSTTNAEKPIESEALSIVFGCERFHEYLYGRHFQIFNDHKPLKAIFEKPITKCPARIQRFMLRLQRYDFELSYSPGKSMIVAGALSRAAVSSDQPEIDEYDVERYVHSVMTALPISDRRMKQL